MTLEEIVRNNAPRERGGRIAKNRTSFEKSFAIYLLLDIHKILKDYTIVFDYYDDVVVFDSSQSPNQISFYQVKSKEDGNWTINKILSRKQGKDGQRLNSILGKMYINTMLFNMFVGESNFVSNVGIRCKLEGKNEDLVSCDFCFNELDTEELKLIKEKLEDELAIDKSEIDEKGIHYISTDFGPRGHIEYIRGKLIESVYGESFSGETRILDLHRLISDIVERKAGYENDCDSINELFIKKGLNKEEFSKILDTYTRLPRLKEIYIKIENKLSMESMPFMETKQIVDKLRELELILLDPNNIAFGKLEDDIVAIIKKENDNIVDLDYKGCIEYIYGKVIKIPSPVKDQYLLKAMVALKLYE